MTTRATKNRTEKASQALAERAACLFSPDAAEEARQSGSAAGLSALAPPKHPLVRREEGDSPVVVAAPHGGKEIPKSLAKSARPSYRRGDLYTREMAETLREISGNRFTIVVALGSRQLVDLNLGGQILPEELRDYYRAYHANISASIMAAGERHGFAVFLDLHGYKDMGPQAETQGILEVDDERPASFVEPGTVYLGTSAGRCVPSSYADAYAGFQKDLLQAGYKVFPPTGFKEHPAFFGGHSVYFHGYAYGYPFPVVAIQLEVPLSIRQSPEQRGQFLRALAAAAQNLCARINSAAPLTLSLPNYSLYARLPRGER